MKREPTKSPELAKLMTDLVLDAGNGSMNRVARMLDIDNATLGKMLDGISPRPEIVARVARAVPQLTEDLYRITGYEMPISLHPVVAQVSRETGKEPMEIVDEALAKLFKGVAQ